MPAGVAGPRLEPAIVTTSPGATAVELPAALATVTMDGVMTGSLAGGENRPETRTTLELVGTYTLPLATMGGANLVISGIWSRAWFMSLFHNSLARSEALNACSVPGVPSL